MWDLMNTGQNKIKAHIEVYFLCRGELTTHRSSMTMESALAHVPPHKQLRGSSLHMILSKESLPALHCIFACSALSVTVKI
ncbi:hypothetical protein GDO86_016798 [Hymenochirus boettgeri]|uniref:Uncharacterized protein n=1 Tax=Hymenochirus boettgeri TaxID=247094 RepID=A0A8T2IHU3_9PIPI|nr:hypothetical protein GDO86_016798 [Hymenochirus boettgeri]